MGVIARFVDFLLYSNIWIAGSAAALYLYSKYLFTSDLSLDATSLFVFFTCTWLYSVHRLIGLSRIDSPLDSYRYSFIAKYDSLIKIIAIGSLIAASILATQLSIFQISILVIPGILSLLYVLPVFKRRRRLRDFNYIKLFIIALVWGSMTILLPLEQCKDCNSAFLLLALFMERCIFVFSLTLPFDIRDLHIDHADNVKTLASRIGIRGVWTLTLLLLSLSSILYIILFYQGLIGSPILYIHLITNLLTLMCIFLALWRKHDWYYTGLLDGTMYLPYLLLFLFLR